MNLFLMNVETVQDADALIDAFLFLKAQFDAIAPTPKMWAQYPWAQWCVIHFSGWRYFFDEWEPFTTSGDSMWRTKGKRCDFYEDVDLPLGIDWRLCKWQRPGGAG